MIPTRWPIYSLAFLVLGLVGCVGVWKAWSAWVATPAQAFYLGSYAKSGLPGMPTFGHGPAMATFPVPNGRPVKRPKLATHAWLRAAVYGNGRALTAPLVACLVVGLGILLIGVVLDHRRVKRLFVDGDQVRGPELITVRQFNGRHKGDGFVLRVR